MPDSSDQISADKTQDADATDFTGRQLGNYVLIRRLGRGGMAEVYLAQQTSLDRPVAIKILKPELAKDQAYIQRFHREAQAAAALVQANIVQIYEIGHIDDVHFIAQEYVRGQNLKQFLNRHQVAEPILAVSILRQVASALQKAAEHGVIHRDIKPENIMLAPNGEVKVTDFGLARVLDDQRTDLTQIGITMGTPLYMSPEQAEGNRVDTRSDIYSLGVTAFHMLTGQVPFDGESPLAIAVKHLKEDPPQISHLRPDLPKSLCDIVHKMLAKSSDNRYQDPGSLLKDLRTIEIDEATDWDSLTEKLTVRDTILMEGSQTVPGTGLNVTRQLETMMTGHMRPWWASPALWIAIGLAAMLGPVAGVLFALANPPPDMLTLAGVSDDAIERKSTVQAQFWYALWNNTEAHWLAVQEYYPQYGEAINRTYYNLAEERLGYLYLAEGRFNQAEVTFAILANLPETEPRLKNVGLAGLAIVYDALGREEDVRRIITDIDVDDLNNGEMATKCMMLLLDYPPIN